MRVNNEFEGTWKEAVLSRWQLPGDTEGDHVKLQDTPAPAGIRTERLSKRSQ
jgi:hypothetical protein